MITLEDVRTVYRQGNKKLIFLDYDGVLNTMFYQINGIKKTVPYTLPIDFEKLYNFYAIALINRFALKHNAKVVVTSSWNCNPRYREILYESGFDSRIQVIGKTEDLGRRYEEILHYLYHHPNFYNFVIFDDIADFNVLNDWLAHCEFEVGITREVIEKAEEILSTPFK